MEQIPTNRNFVDVLHEHGLTLARVEALFRQTETEEDDFSEVKGQHAVKRAIEGAVAENHALLLE